MGTLVHHLYVFSSTFPNGIKHKDDILRVLSLILYTLTVLSLIKYVLIVLKANDKGEDMILLLKWLFFVSNVKTIKINE